ncbi:hypothetical protein MMC20_001600 [Loxospora ochrophaea]|nr:hypothetical protein [Loxospora ochrophaea]
MTKPKRTDHIVSGLQHSIFGGEGFGWSQSLIGAPRLEFDSLEPMFTTKAEHDHCAEIDTQAATPEDTDPA